MIHRKAEFRKCFRNILEHSRNTRSEGTIEISEVALFFASQKRRENILVSMFLKSNRVRSQLWKESDFRTLEDWNGNFVGQQKKTLGLTLVLIDECGHMVPTDQPETSLGLTARFLRES